MAHLLNLDPDVFVGNLLESLNERVGSDFRTKAIVSLGLAEDRLVVKKGSPLNTLSNHLADVMAFGPGERDMLLLRHEVRRFLKCSTVYVHIG